VIYHRSVKGRANIDAITTAFPIVKTFDIAPFVDVAPALVPEGLGNVKVSAPPPLTEFPLDVDTGELARGSEVVTVPDMITAVSTIRPEVEVEPAESDTAAVS